MTTLREVFDAHGTDKGWKHGYDAVYATLPKPRAMLEVGVLRGESLRAWCALWPYATIHGLDVRQPEDFPNYVYWRGDSRTWPGAGVAYDLIIDDGDHTPRAQAATLRNLLRFLAPGGRYFIEDVWPWDIMSEKEKAHYWMREHKDDFNGAAWAELEAALSGLNVTRHDLRSNRAPDSYLIEVRR